MEFSKEFVNAECLGDDDDVPAGEECPLCEQDLETAGFPANALQALFGS